MLSSIIIEVFMTQTQCALCPRECKIDRSSAIGFCRAEPLPRIAKVMLHHWEEPCICYGGGSGAIFFSGCQLQCVFCQNHQISTHSVGTYYDEDQLARLFLKLEEQGACNINLVSPTPHLNVVVPALRNAKNKGLSIPVVFNSGGYEKASTIGLLDGLVDIYMPDFKFFSSDLGKNYAGAENYSEICKAAINEMVKQVESPLWEGDHLLRGVLVRHLVLPAASKDSLAILQWLFQQFGPDGIVLALMRQYTPMHRSNEFSQLSRKVTALEYQRVVNGANEFNFRWVYTQDKESASTEYVPDFTNIPTKND